MLFKILQFFISKKLNLIFYFNFLFKYFIFFSFMLNYGSLIWLLKDPLEIIKFFIKFKFNSIIKLDPNILFELNEIFDKNFTVFSIDELQSNEKENNSDYYLKIFGSLVCITLIGFLLFYNFNGGSSSASITETVSNSGNITTSSASITETVSNSVVDNGYNFEKLTRKFNLMLEKEIKITHEVHLLKRVPAIIEEGSKFINSNNWVDMTKSKIEATILYIIHYSGRK
jgi:hypothetical protein